MRIDRTHNSLKRLAILGIIALVALAFGLATQVQASAMTSYKAQQSQASHIRPDTSLQNGRTEGVVRGDFVVWSTCNEREATRFSIAGQSAVQVDNYAVEPGDDDNDDASPKVLVDSSFRTLGTGVGSNPPSLVFSGTAVRYHTRR